MTTETQTIEHFPELKEVAKRAFYWVSFDPSGRGDRTRKEFGELLNSDIEHLTSNGATEEQTSEYKEKYKRLFVSWLNASSRCASSAVTGGSGFNVRRAENASRSEHRHYEIFNQWRERAQKGILKANKPEKTFMSELERYTLELEQMKANHEKMKEGNRRIKEALKKGLDIADYLATEFNIQPHMLEFTLRWGFGLSNNLANIKRVEERIKLLKQKIDIAENKGNTTINFNGFKVVQNIEIDRLQIIHDTKPSSEVIGILKKNGFKWSPSNSAWQRQLTNNALFTLKHYVLPQLTK